MAWFVALTGKFECDTWYTAVEGLTVSDWHPLVNGRPPILGLDIQVCSDRHTNLDITGFIPQDLSRSGIFVFTHSKINKIGLSF